MPGGDLDTPLTSTIAGLAWVLRTATPDLAGRAELSTSAPHSVADQSPRAVPHVDHRRTSPTPPRPLAPVPPPDGRDAPDPFVLADGGRYVLYSTQVGFHNVPVATSPDLRQWSPPSDALPPTAAAEWGRTWAPGAVRLDGRFLLYFAAHHQASGRQCIGVAASAAGTGPFLSPPPDVGVGVSRPPGCPTTRGVVPMRRVWAIGDASRGST
jgi:hypothetical protein